MLACCHYISMLNSFSSQITWAYALLNFLGVRARPFKCSLDSNASSEPFTASFSFFFLVNEPGRPM